MIRKVGLGKVGLDRRQLCSGVAVCGGGGGGGGEGQYPV